MPARIESSGDIETICQSTDMAAGGTAKFIFRAWDDVTPPFTIKVRGPDGKMLLDRVIRELPTGRPQSAPPVTFVAPSVGPYKIEIAEIYGSKKTGNATLHVT